LTLRVLFTLLVARHHPGIGDFFFYHRSANALADGQGYIDPFLSAQGNPYPSALHPPLWPFALSVSSLLGGTGFTAHRLVGCLAGAVTVFLVGLIARRVGGERVGLIAAGLAAIYPVLIAADSSLMSEGLYGTMVAAVLLAALRAVERPTVGRIAVLGGATGLAILTRGEALLFVPLLLLPLAWRGGKRARVTRLAAALAAVMVVVAPWTVRNWIQFDRPVLVSTNDATVVAGANCRLVYRGPAIGLWDIDCISKVDRALDEAEQTARWRREGVRYARENAGRLVAVVPARVLRTWGLYQPAKGAEQSEGGARWMKRAATASYYLVAAAALAGAWVLRRRGATLLVLLTPVLVVTLSSAASFGLPRFREAAEIALVVLAAAAAGRPLASRATPPRPA